MENSHNDDHGDGRGGGVPSLPAQPNARADGLDQLSARLASFVASCADGQPAAGATPTRASDAVPERLAVRAHALARRRRIAVGASAAIGALLVAGLSARTLLDRPEATLSYTVDGVAPPRGGYVRSFPEHDHVLAFSDGTRIQMMPRARARVVEVDRRGARVVLEQGRAHVEVAHRPGADWQFQAGAFLIHVHGTAFFVEWNTDEARLDVRMENGVVSVDGPRPGDSVVLRAGQSLSISDRDQPRAAPTAASPAPDLTGHPPSPEAAGPAPRAATAAPAPHTGWPERLGQGQAAAIVAEAERRGLARVLARGSSEDLAALADAARYRQRDALARRALLAQRRRFAGTVRAEEASFLLGRLEDRAAGDSASALAWYDRYLRDAPRGTYAAEALGRKMIVLQRQHRETEARDVAVDYLRRFPAGTYAQPARALVPSSR